MPLFRFAHARRALAALAFLVAASCTSDDTGSNNDTPVLSAITVTAPVATLGVGQATTATAAGLDQHGVAIATGAVVWSSSATTIATVSAAGQVTAIAAGTADIIATVGTVTGKKAVTVNAPAAIRISEVESNGGTPGDWVEFYNPTAAAVDMTGWVVKDDDDTHSYALPAGSTIQPGGYLVVDEAQFGFGLGAPDKVRLFSPFGTAIDSYTWTTHAPTTYGRCTTAAATLGTTTLPTKGAANDCSVALIVNEVESNGGTPGDWAEFYNTGPVAVDLSGYVFKDNDDTHSYVLPAGTTVPAGGYLVVEEAQFGFGLGAPDAVRLFSPAGGVVASYAWTTHATTTYGRCPNVSGPIMTATVSTKGAANDCSISAKINEVESNGGTPGDWVELINTGPATVDLAGYVVKDNDDTHAYTLPAGSTVAPGGFLIIEEAALNFGLGGDDAVRLYAPGGTTPVDQYAWTAHAAITYGRCPDGTGVFAATTASTKAAANTCTPTGPVVSPWPGTGTVTTVDGTSVFGSNLSGLTYEGAAGGNPAVLWAVQNGPGTLYRLVWNGTIWTQDASDGWATGKPLRYTNGTGNPDSEGTTYAAAGSFNGIYVSTERNNDASTISRNSILRFDPLAPGTTLTATNDWNITADLPVVGANLGIEAITWVPDAYLTANGFFDEKAGHLYNPAEYANHAGGIFFVGVEANGIVYAYALNHTDNTFTRVATITTGFPGVMGMEYDHELNYLWVTCDDGCGGKSLTLEIDTGAASPTKGKFVVTHTFDRPATMPNINNEGFAIAPQSECAAGQKFVFWSDDGETGGHSIRRATVPCTRFP